MQNREFITDFVEESIGHLDSLEMGLVQIGEGSMDPKIMDTIFRAVHSIKGTAGFFSLKNVVALAHIMESRLGEMKHNQAPVHGKLIDRLLRASDLLKAMIMDVETSDDQDIASMLSELSDHPDDQEAAEKELDIREINEIIEVKEVKPEVLPASNLPILKEVKKLQKVHTDDTLRVQVSLLNDLLDMAGEMVLVRNQMLRILQSYRKTIPNLNSVLQHIDTTTTELQEKIMQTRMQPVSKVFNKFPRIIRELSKELGKEIELYMEGTEVELDKSLIEALTDPLNHLVRNAIDHGIEEQHMREKLGKSQTGIIMLKAYHEGDHVTIDVTDDGAGIQVDKIEKKAIQRGLLTSAEASEMSDRELMKFLFHPGFSTANELTNISGRGIGMDVVKTNIEKIGGYVEIMTIPGKGSTFRLTLPLTLAIIPSLVVEVEGNKFALPQVNLQEMLRIKQNDPTRKLEKIRDSWVLRLRGKLLPIVHLADVLGIRSDSFDKLSEVYRVLVLKTGSKRFGLAVDIIHDREEILVKSLPRFFHQSSCYFGVTIMGDGKSAMILDPEGIAEKVKLRFHEETALESVIATEKIDEQQNLLLFSCSGPEILCVDLSFVVRVEKIDSSQIEQIGQKEYIQFRGDALRIIRPEQYLPINSVENNKQKLYIIIPKIAKQPIGILIEQVHDTIVTSIQFTSEEIKAKGLIGSTILNNRLVQLINMYELFEMAVPEHYPWKESKKKPEKTVLLVEDTPFYTKTIENYLISANYSILKAANGKEAWRILQEEQIDAVLCDTQMPIMDGFELVKRIRSDKRLKVIPVIALTTIATNQYLQDNMDAGFDDFVAKLDKYRLLEQLQNVLQTRRKAI
ncbi:chemotaxis protein CheW [Paenibacillus sp. GP183]|uniref:hybrid sensor histidine kinase/response regulator n=1 Tax=Paenibacillus sp. GP183 TaxID=1882751 RepID=UPI00089A95C9|nr:chemotaxis protein CheW [Paenibacillus sp. GP183]SEB52621.1 two-component system, chemotaxis family, sensor kinase CheA [Paenibacillus sp. GP183]